MFALGLCLIVAVALFFAFSEYGFARVAKTLALGGLAIVVLLVGSVAAVSAWFEHRSEQQTVASEAVQAPLIAAPVAPAPVAQASNPPSDIDAAQKMAAAESRSFEIQDACLAKPAQGDQEDCLRAAGYLRTPIVGPASDDAAIARALANGYGAWGWVLS